jgi:hypothetical protein
MKRTRHGVSRPARLDLLGYDAAGNLRDVECTVRVNATGLAIEAPGLAFRAHGLRVAPGHFMMMTSDGRVGSLHRYPGGEAFEGWWNHRGMQGFWRICATRPPSARPGRGARRCDPARL